MVEPQGQSLRVPWKPPATDRHVVPPEPSQSKHTTEHLFTNSPDGAVLTPAPHTPALLPALPNSLAWARWRPALLLPPTYVLGKSRGSEACRYRPRQACATHRWPPSGGFQCSLLSKDKLSNSQLFYEFTPRSISQKRLRKILGLSSSTLRQNCSLKKLGSRRPGQGSQTWTHWDLFSLSPQWGVVNHISTTGTDVSVQFVYTVWLQAALDLLCCHHWQV